VVEEQQRGVCDGARCREGHRAEFVHVAKASSGTTNAAPSRGVRARARKRPPGASVVAADALAQPLCLGLVEERGVHASVVHEGTAHPAGHVRFALSLLQPCVRVGGRVEGARVGDDEGQPVWWTASNTGACSSCK